MEVKSKELKLGDQEFIFRLNFRAMIEFEKMSGKSISNMDYESMIDNSMLLYCGIVAGMSFEKKSLKIKYEEFVDLIDSNINALMTLLIDDDKKAEDPKN